MSTLNVKCKNLIKTIGKMVKWFNDNLKLYQKIVWLQNLWISEKKRKISLDSNCQQKLDLKKVCN